MRVSVSNIQYTNKNSILFQSKVREIHLNLPEMKNLIAVKSDAEKTKSTLYSKFCMMFDGINQSTIKKSFLACLNKDLSVSKKTIKTFYELCGQKYPNLFTRIKNFLTGIDEKYIGLNIEEKVINKQCG